jgi:hypothetical protein
MALQELPNALAVGQGRLHGHELRDSCWRSRCLGPNARTNAAFMPHGSVSAAGFCSLLDREAHLQRYLRPQDLALIDRSTRIDDRVLDRSGGRGPMVSVAGQR